MKVCVLDRRDGKAEGNEEIPSHIKLKGESLLSCTFYVKS